VTKTFSLFLLGSTLVAGCGPAKTQDEAVFGGEGAQVEGPDSQPLGPEDERPQLTGPCAKAPPPGKDAKLDDFEDGDHQLFKTYHREGWWFTADDGTEGATFIPPKGEFKGTPLPEGERTSDNELAVHMKADGLKDWGIVWGTTLRWKDGGLSCPFNASHFDGIRFRAKGAGELKLKISTIETSPPDNGGVCKEGCWDAHGKVIRLEESWRDYYVRWEDLQQEGWGKDSRFDTTRLLALNFTAAPAMLPIELWVDDVAFIEKGEVAPAAPTPTPTPATAPASAGAPAPATATPAPTTSPAAAPSSAAPAPAAVRK
jgi:hypothetical protein